jgi:hypothetical protein
LPEVSAGSSRQSAPPSTNIAAFSRNGTRGPTAMSGGPNATLTEALRRPVATHRPSALVRTSVGKASHEKVVSVDQRISLDA